MALALGLYAGALDAGFAFDDAVAVQTNPLVTGARPASAAWSQDFWGERPGFAHIASWRPLTVLSLRADHQIDAGAAWPFHATNIALHLLILLAVLWLAIRLELPVPLAIGAAVVVAVHPVFAEAVVSIVGRGDLLATLFGVVGLASWTVHPLLGLVGLGLALTAKESAVVFVAAALLLAFREPRRRRWALLLVALGVGWYAVRSAVVGHLGGVVPVIDNPIAGMGATDRLVAGLGAVGRYVAWFVVPQEIAADHAAAVDLSGGGAYAGFGAMTGALVTLAGLRAARTLAWPGVVGSVVALASLLLLSNVPFLLPTPMGGRLAYAPALGLTLLVAASLRPLVADGPRRVHLAVGGLVAVWLLAGAPSTLGMVAAWQGDRPLFEAAVRLEPASARAWANLGRQQLNAGELEAAEVSTRTALELVADHPVALVNLALVLDASGQRDEAWATALRAADREPRPGRAAANVCAFAVGRPDVDAAAAVSSCEVAASALPAQVEPLVNLARAHQRVGALDRAEATFQEALRRFPGTPFGRGHWVGFLVSQQRLVEAVAVQRSVLADAPEDPQARQNLIALVLMLAQAQRQGGDAQRACETARGAVALAPGVAAVLQRARAFCPEGGD